MTITNLKMGGINKKRESVEQVTANLENFHHNIFDVETFPVDFHRSMFHLLHFPPPWRGFSELQPQEKCSSWKPILLLFFWTMMHCTHPMILTSSSPCLCMHYQGDQSPWLLTWIKMTGRWWWWWRWWWTWWWWWWYIYNDEVYVCLSVCLSRFCLFCLPPAKLLIYI